MAKYSIKDLESLTGLKAHTIRIWEQRYSLLEPDRTDTNIRTYDDKQVKKLLVANALYSRGLKISKIAALSEEQMQSTFSDLSAKGSDNDIVIEALTVAMIDMNENKFDGILQRKIQEEGLEKTMSDVVYPFLERIGVLWLTNVIEPAQEHFISNLIRQKIVAAINLIEPTSKTDAPVCIAFLHQEEMHELGLLYYSYLLKLSGYKILYLGQMTPYADVLLTSTKSYPDIILTSFVKAMDSQLLDEYVERLLTDFSDAKILISGIVAANCTKEAANLYKISSYDHLKEVIKHLDF